MALCRIDWLGGRPGKPAGWCDEHDSDCGLMSELEAWAEDDPTDPAAYPTGGQHTPGRVPDEVRRPHALVADEGGYR